MGTFFHQLLVWIAVPRRSPFVDLYWCICAYMMLSVWLGGSVSPLRMAVFWAQPLDGFMSSGRVVPPGCFGRFLSLTKEA